MPNKAVKFENIIDKTKKQHVLVLITSIRWLVNRNDDNFRERRYKVDGISLFCSELIRLHPRIYAKCTEEWDKVQFGKESGGRSSQRKK